MATRPLPEAAEYRFAPYIEELHEFFATSGVRFGTPQDIAPITDRLRTSGTFSKDLSSLVRSFVLRQGGAMPHAQLMEILSSAMAGPEMATSPQQYREPLRELLTFVTSVMNRPWNVPPGDRMEAEIVPFPNESGESQPELGPLPEMPDVPEAAAEPPPVPQLTPMPIDLRTPVGVPAAGPSEEEDLRQVETLSDPGLLEVRNPLRETAPPMSAISAALAAESERTGHVQEPIQPIARIPVEESALRPAQHPIPTHAPLPAVDDADGEPRRLAVSRAILIAAAGCLFLAVVLVVADRLHAGHEVAPEVGSQVSNAPTNQVPPQPVPLAPSAGSPVVAPEALAAPAKPSADGAPLTGQALRRARQLAAEAGNEDVAEPYSSAPQYAPRNVFGKAPADTPPATTVSPQGNAAASSYSGSVNAGANSGGATQAPAPVVRKPVAVVRPSPRDPDRALAGEPTLSSTGPPPPAYVRVSAGVMASNIVSAPQPDYPMLARIAHIRGQVVLEALIARDGTVSSTRVLSGNHLLRGAALNAVRSWRYRPYRINGRSVGVSTTVAVDFPLGDKAHD